MKLYELSVGQRFTFSDKHRGKVFEVVAKTRPHASRQGIHYKDVATGEVRDAKITEESWSFERHHKIAKEALKQEDTK